MKKAFSASQAFCLIGILGICNCAALTLSWGATTYNMNAIVEKLNQNTVILRDVKSNGVIVLTVDDVANSLPNSLSVGDEITITNQKSQSKSDLKNSDKRLGNEPGQASPDIGLPSNSIDSAPVKDGEEDKRDELDYKKGVIDDRLFFYAGT